MKQNVDCYKTSTTTKHRIQQNFEDIKHSLLENVQITKRQIQQNVE